MSQRLIGLNPDLRALRNEGYNVEVRGGYLLIKDVPYVRPSRNVGLGTLVSPLEMTGDRTNRPSDHTTTWSGEHPCHSDGTEISKFKNSSQRQDLGNGIVIDHRFSAKAEYRDYYHKMTTYIGRITGEAQKIDPTVTACSHPPYRADNENLPFKYIDTASSRSGIGQLNDKLAALRIAIVGLGGSGSYVLDLVAKTPVRSIHVFDGDVFSSHNAFRAPGAAALEDLEARPTKVDHFGAIYRKIHNCIVAVNAFISEANVHQLRDFDFVFMCLDQGAIKKLIATTLETANVPFIDVGIGVVWTGESLSGLVRVTTSSVKKRAHVWRGRIPLLDADDDANEYSTNIQIAELNALSATLAVIKWKKLFGFYRDGGDEHYSGYSIAQNELINEEPG